MSVHTTQRQSEYREALAWLYELQPATIKLGLERTEALLAAVGDPHAQFPSVHITGTTGKGSTAAITESILRAAGYKTGLYTSPHIFDLEERFRVGGQSISQPDMTDLIHELRVAMEDQRIDATFHEFTTSLAFLHFARQKVDIAVVEVCMGGLLDTTNVITPLVSVITNIGIDHTKWLGSTKKDIAREKAGIVKRGVPFVTAEKDPAIRTYLEFVAKKQNAPFYHVHDQLAATPVSASAAGQSFDVVKRSGGEATSRFELALNGEHQVANALTALTAVSVLRDSGWMVSDSALAEGVATARWSGRLDVVSEKPFVLVDGANNAQSIDALRAFIDEHMPHRNVLVYAKKEDKDLTPALDLIIPLFDEVIVTEGLFQPEPAAQLARRIEQKHSHVTVEPDAQKATARALESVDDSGGVLITGSLYMITEALRYLRELKPNQN